MYISIYQALSLWDTLRDLSNEIELHGYATEKEFYAYELMAHDPSLGMNLQSIDETETCRNAAKSLIDIIELFLQKYPSCQILLDGQNYRDWYKENQTNFKHRVKIGGRRKEPKHKTTRFSFGGYNQNI